ncbi:alpha-glucosidase/alpha-galactosidase [Harryflintia acetispora]|uniref:Alpha-galactosidase n=1 Tax=Harryflintia acetispora TaxID=1849041 RepID=A0A9X8Y7I3_9FIRM|nr:alpha-glucosidase/alpha-galactosidase [Harryflintia acetispora]TCL42329.1 alpha-galactosidase [Harryflintia acetispora]
MKISIIGAGSAFTQKIVIDILRIEGLEGGELALVDTNAERLDLARRIVEMTIDKTKKTGKWSVSASTDLREVIGSSKFVINEIEVMGLQTVKNEFEIPLKYGVKQCIGDTMGPGGLFKTLRLVPQWLKIVKVIEELCPEALILSYSNPMSAVTLATSLVTDIPVVGLCHSVQYTARKLAELLEVPYEELKYSCAGINHMSWYTTLTHRGRDLYPELKRRAEDPEFIKNDPVRLDFLRYCGYFVTESSGHFSEYIPYYRKRQDLIDAHCSLGYNGGTGFYAYGWPEWRKNRDEMIRKQLAGEEDIVIQSSEEYAPVIIGAVVKDEPAVIYGNVPNRGLIENLRSDGVVEVACLCDHNGVTPCRFGKLPEHLAALNRSNMDFFSLAVGAVLEGSRDMAEHALMLDPLSAAVCSPAEIRSMFEELLEADRDYIVTLK